MNETLKTLTERRSIRKFESRQIDPAQLEAILKAGTYAPCGKGAQSACMVVVQDPETLQKLSKMNAAVLGNDSDPFYAAPTAIVVLADPAVATCVEDGALVMGNLMNAAWSLGVGSCWIHRARPVFESAEGRELLKKWGVPENYIGVAHCVLGYPAGEIPAPKPRKENYICRT